MAMSDQILFAMMTLKNNKPFELYIKMAAILKPFTFNDFDRYFASKKVCYFNILFCFIFILIQYIFKIPCNSPINSIYVT